MPTEDLQGKYIDKINSDIVSKIDFTKLDRSCNSGNNAYAAKILKELHQAFVEVYGTENLQTDMQFVCVPAMLRGCTTGRNAVGLVILDLESSGEHYGSYFFTERGVLDDDGDPNNSPQGKAYLKEHFMPYDYWYTAYCERDHHVDFDHVPASVADIINQCYQQDQSEQHDMKME